MTNLIIWILIAASLAGESLMAQSQANGCRTRPATQFSTRPLIYRVSGTSCYWIPRERRYLRGDAEFSGNGPDISVTAQLNTVGDTAVRVILTLRAEETPVGSTGSRHTIIQGASPPAGFLIFSAPKGFRIRSARPRAKEFHVYVDRDPNTDVVRPACVYQNGCVARDILSKTIDPNAKRSNTSNHGLVDTWVITGDTRGSDFGDTGVQAVLGPIDVELERKR